MAESLSGAFEREHHAIDVAVEQAVAGLTAGEVLAEPLESGLADLRRHIYLEEEHLFPPLREAGLMAPIFVMLREHGELWRSTDRVAVLLAEAAPASAILQACQELVGQLGQHNAKEEPIIYPQADQVLTAAAQADLLAQLETASLPTGWVCQQAAPASGR
jgi:iron-sulfur cluster repair protein YtfE (RIC family)